MALSDWELWASANEVIRQYGTKAALHAAKRASELAARGAEDGRDVWLMILDRIEQLQCPAPPGPLN